jgi:hypothetical protein
MVVVFMGGLGNQAFQWAFGVSVAKAKGEDIHFMWREGEWRAYSLGAFNCRVDLVKHTTGLVLSEPVFAFDQSVYTYPKGSSFIGHWQTEKYFDAQLVRDGMSLRNPVSDKTREVAEAIQNAGEKSAFLHVRRTDYMLPSNVAYHGHPTLNYYNETVRRVRERHEDAKFFVFSDEPDWCKATFPDFTVVDHNKMGVNGVPGQEHEDIYLMSLCRHAAIANSSFSWWGAWLGDTQPDRLVFAPKQWFVVNLESKDIVPDRWVKLEN